MNTIGMATDVIYRADVLDPIRNFIQPWVPALQVLGGVILAGCLVVVGTKAGVGAAASSANTNASSGIRGTLGSVGLIALGGLLIGVALIATPIFINIGKSSNGGGGGDAGGGAQAASAPAAPSALGDPLTSVTL